MTTNKLLTSCQSQHNTTSFILNSPPVPPCQSQLIKLHHESQRPHSPTMSYHNTSSRHHLPLNSMLFPPCPPSSAAERCSSRYYLHANPRNVKRKGTLVNLREAEDLSVTTLPAVVPAVVVLGSVESVDGEKERERGREGEERRKRETRMWRWVRRLWRCG